MRHTLNIRAQALLSALLALTASVFAFAQGGSRGDVVDELRKAISFREEDSFAKSADQILSYRRENLPKKAAKLRTVSELRRGLALEEWKKSPNPAINQIDAEVRQEIGARFTKAIDEIIKSGNANSRLAIANAIAEMGPTVRGLGKDETSGFARSLTPQVIELTKDKDLGVRQEALRALGNIFPKPQEAAPVFEAVLGNGKAGPKRLAADGLGQLLRVVSHLQKQSGSGTGILAGREDVVEAIVAVLAANRVGLLDPDVQVRALSLQNIQTAAEALAEPPVTRDPSQETFPPPDRKLSVEDKGRIMRAQGEIEEELKTALPAINALRAQGPSLARSLEDSDPKVRLATLEALENVGYARLRIKKRVLSVPLITPAEGGGNVGIIDLLARNDMLEELITKSLSSIAKILRDPSVELRRKTVEFLEIIEDKALPALPLLAEVLDDPDRFVRLSAARAIANIAPGQASVALPGLSKLLSDHDLSVRLQAARTLKELGPSAGPAAPALARAIVEGDAEARLAAMEALQAVGTQDGKIAVSNLIHALEHQDARVRRVAARTLGGFGPDARAALPALRRALGDDEQEVRMSASDAISDISQPRDKSY